MIGSRPNSKRVIIAITALLIMTTFTVRFSSSEPSRDSFDNDSFETADEIHVRVEPWEGSLDPTDTHDFYVLMGLEGDNENDQRNTQLIRIGLQKNNGSAVKAVVYEPNRLELGAVTSDGMLDEIEFIVPRDGGFFIEVFALTLGQSCSYGIYLGGETGVDNSDLHDRNNVPPGTGITSSVNIADSLDPRGDLVDYWHITIPGYRAMEVSMSFLEGLPFHLQVLDDNMTPLEKLGSDDRFVVENGEADELKIILRAYLLLSNDDRPNTKKTYYVEMVIWSYLTRPEIDPQDEWDLMETNEDTPLYPPINLSQHFREPNSDPVEFKLVNEPEHLEVQFNYTVIDRQLMDDLVYVEVEVIPEKNWHGSEVLTFMCSDRDGNVTDSVEILVHSVNDIPYITRIGDADYDGGIFNMFALEDIPKSYEITYFDDDDPLENIHFSSNETYDFLSVDPSNGTVTIDAVQSDVGNFWFSLSMTDGRDTVVVDINLDIQPVNDPPPDPEIIVVEGNISSILPGQEIVLKAVSGPDVDGDELFFYWDWGDDKTDEGEISSHIYGEGIYGNRTVELTISDGLLEKSTSIKIYLEKPEDIAKDNVEMFFDDVSGDVVRFKEEWRQSDPDGERKFKVSKVKEPGVDIVSLKSERRGNDLHISLRVRDSVQIDGSFHYYIYVLPSGYEEPFVDLKNVSGWDNISSRAPAEEPYVFRQYVGDPSIHNGSSGVIHNKHTLIWVVPLQELKSAGLPLPMDGDDFTLFAVTEHIVPYSESKGLVERYIMSDTAGSGALVIGDISTRNTTSGSGSTPFSDLGTTTVIGVVVGLIIAFLVVMALAMVLMKRQIKEKKKEEEEFLQYVESMNRDGRGLFERDDEKEKNSGDFEKVYGAPKLESFMTPPESDRETASSGNDLSPNVKVNWDEDDGTEE